MATKNKRQEKAVIALWDFPKEDFPLWKKLCSDEEDFESFEEYHGTLNRIELLLKQTGTYVLRMPIGVRAMMVRLAQEGLENTSANRSRVLAMMAQQEGAKRALDDVNQN